MPGFTGEGLETVGDRQFADFPATGVKPARRPSVVETRGAFEIALGVRFDADNTVLSVRTMARHLRDRRKGRPYRAGGVVNTRAAA